VPQRSNLLEKISSLVPRARLLWSNLLRSGLVSLENLADMTWRKASMCLNVSRTSPTEAIDEDIRLSS
jgi:hypothetical protein